MRAPLRAMQSFSKILSEEYAERIGNEGNDYIRRINSAAARMDSLIQDVLTYSRVSRTDLPLQPVDVGELLHGIIETYPTFQPPVAYVAAKGNFPWVLGIPAVLTQCISNLLGNGVKFVAPGVTPTITVWAELSPDEKTVRLLFKDNGLGIEREAHETIFGIFQRVSKNFDGTGIGLSIVKKGMERMGGRVGLASAPGEGSTFWLDLNRSTSPDPVPHKPVPHKMEKYVKP
jgi:signal transduction histidine kinase